MTKNEICIGLFGTCDNIKWRDSFMPGYKDREISYFNPMVDDWEPWMVEEENKHFATDDIILFPVLKESLGLGSLAEIGFSVMSVLRDIMNGKNRYLVVLIDDEVDPAKDATDAEKKYSRNARALVKSKVLKYANHPNIFLVDTLPEMFSLSYKLHSMIMHQNDINNDYMPKQVS